MYKLETIKKNINNFILAGGNIYSPKRKLPYYSYMNAYKRQLEKTTGKKYEMSDIYEMSGIKYDKWYSKFLDFKSKIKAYADDDGYVDSYREGRGVKDSAHEIARSLTYMYDIQLSDFVLYFTVYRLKSVNVPNDYVALLQKDLLEAYPSRDLTGIKRDNPGLYCRMNHLRTSLDVRFEWQEFVESLGFITRAKAPSKHKEYDENAILAELNKLYPDKNVVNLSTINGDLYYTLVELTISLDTTIRKWLESHGFNYERGSSVSRLKQTKVDGDQRKNELLRLKEEMLASTPKDKIPTDPRERFYFDINMLKQIEDKLFFSVYSTDEEAKVTTINN